MLTKVDVLQCEEDKQLSLSLIRIQTLVQQNPREALSLRLVPGVEQDIDGVHHHDLLWYLQV
jgi:hypothetical protein